MEHEFGMASLKMVGALMVVLGLILGLFYGLKRLRPRILASGRVPQMRLLGTLNLAPRRALALVEVADHWLIVGVGTESVNLITNIGRPEGDVPDEAPVSEDGKSFQGILQSHVLRPQGARSVSERKHENS